MVAPAVAGLRTMLISISARSDGSSRRRPRWPSGFVLMCESTVMDFRDIASAGPDARRLAEDAFLQPGVRTCGSRATAYCKGTTTASGVNVRTGIAAADPDLLPVGSVIQVYRLGERYNGIYTIMDTGPAVQGRHIDIYMWSCNEALQLGRARHRRSTCCASAGTPRPARRP